MPRQSRSSRRSTSHTPAVEEPSASTSRSRPPSPYSPTRVSRMEEKMTMQNLNDRLVSYIDRVRSQEMEINQLQQSVSTIEEQKTCELTTVKDRYGHEMIVLRKALDVTSKEKAKLEIDADKFEKEAKEAKSKLKEREKVYDNASKQVRALQNQLDKLQADHDSDKAELRDLKPEFNKVQKKLDDAKKNLEDETLKRIDLQNQLQSAEEGLKFENQLLEQQLNETKVRKQIEITEMDGRLNDEYEKKMQASLFELRESHDIQQKEHNEQMTRLFENKIKNLQSRLDDARKTGAGSVHQVTELTTRIMSLESRNAELESTNMTLQTRINDLIAEMEATKNSFRQRLVEKDAEVRSKEEQMEDMKKDYDELMGIKIKLDLEINTYRKILEGEEERLGMSPTGSPSATPAGRGVKRKRTTIVEEDVSELVTDHTGKGNVTIEPLDKDGKFVKLRNSSGSQINIGGWTLTNVTGGEDVAYKFHRSTTLEDGEVCTVWSSDTHETHEPPLNLVMKKGGWEIGDENLTSIKSKDGEEEATRTSRRARTLSGSTRYGLSELHSYRGEEGGDSKCVVM